MDLQAIKQKLGVLGELTPEQRRGISDALSSILDSRQASGMPPIQTDAEIDMGVDPALKQPSSKAPLSVDNDMDLEINDPDDLLSSDGETPAGTDNDSGKASNSSNSSNSGGSNTDSDNDTDEGNATDSGDAENDAEADADGAEGDNDEGPGVDSELEDEFSEEDSIVGFETEADRVANQVKPRRIAASRAKKLGAEALNAAKGAQGAENSRKTDVLKQALADIETLLNMSDADLAALSGEVFQQKLNRVTDAAKALNPASHVEDEVTRQARLKEIKADFADKRTALELDAEAKQQAAGTSGIQASKATKDAYAKVGNYGTIADFKINFYRCIKDQVQEAEELADTWSVINRRHDGTDRVVRGQKNERLPIELIPSVEVYIDCSGSWKDEDIKIGDIAVKQLLEFETKQLVDIKLIYFANHLHDNKESARYEGGTDAWPHIIANINRNKTKNVVLITDDDMHWDAGRNPKCVVPGCV